jgi:predicted metal-dependent HD superfamily phosphohydrolase
MRVAPGKIDVTLVNNLSDNFETMFLIARWFEAWASLGVPGNPELILLHSNLMQCYSESHRHYHTLQHLAECFDHLSELKPHLAHKPEVELALWFHDAIYDTHREDNEALSALWAADSARSTGVSEPSVRRIAQLVMATCHAAEPKGKDAEALVDADLGILGAASERFFEYESQIRQEYAWVPEPAFRAKRVEILTRLLDRPHIFSTELFRNRYEARARANLLKSIHRLTKSL